MAEIHDRTGAPVTHGRARVCGIRMHYVTAGRGEPLLQLLHGTPMRKVAERVERAEVYEACGHSLALEAEHRLAAGLRDFMLGR